MSISKDVIKQCLISKQREVDEAVIVNRPTDFEENGNYVIVGVRHAGKSYLLYQRVRQLQAAGMGWDEILFVDFEDERLAEFQTEDFNSLLEAHLELYGCGMEICPNDTLCQITSNNACVRYSFLTPSADWYELNYDDGLWGLGGGPLGSKRWCKTKWSSQHFIYATVFIIVQ